MKFIRTHRKLLVAVILVLLAVAAIPLARGFSAEALLAYKPSRPWLAALALVGIYCVKPALMFIPTYGLYVLGGLLLPPAWAIFAGYAGLACELSLGFGLGRWLGQDKVRQLAGKYPKAKKALGYLGGNSQYVCFVTRVLPMPYPVDLGSMVFGASGMGFWPHLVFSLLGLSAVMIPITLAGGNLGNPLSARFIVPFAISIAVSAALMIAYRVWARRRAAAGGGEEDAPTDAKTGN